MKPSSFNLVCRPVEGTDLFFNFYTLKLISLPSADSRIAWKFLTDPEQTPSNPDETALRDLLQEHGFLIDSGVNEIPLLFRQSLAARLDNRRLSLTVAPTLSCNFRCSYCYQPATRNRMNRDVETALIDFVTNRLMEKGSLHVTWFGGEPLLEMSRISHLSDSLIRICQEKKSDYSASIVTNGYLLDSGTVDELLRIQISSAQITLDGPPDIHNERRKLKGGGPTFSVILGNLHKAREKVSISLRMNVDQSNKDRIEDMLHLLKKEGLEKSVGFYIGHVRPYTDICGDISGTCLKDEAYSLLSLETMIRMLKMGFSSTFHMPRSRNLYCMADIRNAFVVTPDGSLFKCWNSVGQENDVIGHLMEPISEKMTANQKNWLRRDPFALECRKCRLLPICMGGCPYIYLRTGKLDCDVWKHHLDEYIHFYYLTQTMEWEAEVITKFQKIVDSIRKLKSQDAPL